MRVWRSLALGALITYPGILVTISQAEACPIASLPTTPSDSPSEASSQLDTLLKHAYNVTLDSLGSNAAASKRGTCTAQNLSIRREWSTFSYDEKIDYINAVLCLQKLPSLTPSALAPGAKTRYDDFVATHINQTEFIHFTGTFLAWHRYFISMFEQALKNECGYGGTLPYWSWPASAEDLETYSVFDGSETSLSGNGALIVHESEIILTLPPYPPLYLPPGTGGGCVTGGPFVNYSINMGPAALVLPGGATLSVSNPLNYNPRCFKRDLTTQIIRMYANASSVVSLILDNDNIWDFEMTMQGVPGSGSIGVHGGGHYAMGGDPGRDIFVSPGDPAFFLHHGMIDLVWWIWQSLDPENRLNAISGTGTFLNNPPSANTTLDTLINLGFAAGSPTVMAALMSTVDGPFCYVYV